MSETIRFKGLSLSRDEHAATHGELALCAGVELHDGALRPTIVCGEEVSNPLTDADGNIARLTYIHETTAYRHFIAVVTDAQTSAISIYWFQADGTRGGLIHTLAADVTIQDINSIGNTLVILASDSMHYVLWKDDAYTHIGTHIPDLPLSFGLQGRRVESDQEFSISFNQSVPWDSSIRKEFNEELKTSISNQVLGKVNKFVDEYYTEGNEFIYPFFVRYALRLYDGTLTMHSAPILMVCSTGQMPYLLGSNIHQKDDGFDYTWDEQSMNNCKVYCALFKLDFAVVAQSFIDELKRWSDIVTSVDIFISQPLYSYDQSGRCTSIEEFNFDDDDYCICKATHGGEGFNSHYQYHQMAAFMWYGKSSNPGYRIKLPMKGENAINENIRSCAQFFFLKSYNLDQLSTSRTIVDIENGYFRSLVNREQMTDDYDSHSTLIPQKAFAYNQRLNIINIIKHPFHGYHAASQFCFTNGFVQYKNGRISQGPDYTYDSKKDNIIVFVYLKKDGKTYIVCGNGFEFGLYNKLTYIYYPDPAAYKVVVYRNNLIIKDEWNYSPDKYFEAKLTPHPMLNGAVYFDNFNEPTKFVRLNLFWNDKVNTGTISLANKIYTSEVNNPYHFPVNGINTVGLGSITGIAAATRALSQGQFGQFPLMAFSTDGIWALAVSSTGTYSSIHNISREVCSNPISITQLDQSVIFVTARSLSRIAESTVVSMSDILDGPYFNVKAQLDRLATYFDVSLNDSEEEQAFKNDIGQLLDFDTSPIDFFQSCRVIYDFVSSRLLCIPDTETDAPSTDSIPIFIYSIRDNAWSTALIKKPLASINSNPYPYIQDTSGFVTCLNNQYDYTDEELHPGLIVSRSLRFSELPAAITAFNQEHNNRQKAVLFLFGSMDNRTWRYIGRTSSLHSDYLPGHSFRFFRLAVYLRMSASEQYMSTAITIREKYKKY